MRFERPLRVAIFATNNASNYSGGRYHALVLGYAMLRAGLDVVFVTNVRPHFVTDLDPLAPGRMSYAVTSDFRAALPEGDFDYVVMTPTGIFQPDYYEAVLDFARERMARLALINFESGNWFNAMAPQPRDLRLWDYWRRAVAQGGMVLSSLRVADRHARDFYSSGGPDPLRFEICSPPINSLAADLARGRERDGSVLVFSRSRDQHKGGGDLLALEPALLAGRILRVVSGGAFDPHYLRALYAHFEPAGVWVDARVAISDIEKYDLLARAQALLFPSRFEGFGYPPVEAAYMGTEVVCYDLPVLQETVGGVAHMAPVGDVAALGAALRAALDRPASPERVAQLHKAVAGRVGIDAAAGRIADVLLRGLDRLQPLPGQRGAAAWGPAAGTKSDPAALASPPSVLLGLSRGPEGQLLLAARVTLPGGALPLGLRLLQAADHSPVAQAAITSLGGGGDSQGVHLVQIAALLPQPEGDVLDLVLVGADGTALRHLHLLDCQPAEAPVQPVRLRAIRPSAEGDLFEFHAPESVRLILRPADGGEAVAVAVVAGCATIRIAPDRWRAGTHLYAQAADGGLCLLRGLPPVAMGQQGAATGVPGDENTLRLEPRTDHGEWLNGVLRHPGQDAAGGLSCSIAPDAAWPEIGDRIMLASGRAVAVTAIHPVQDPDDLQVQRLQLSLCEPVDPQEDGYPAAIRLMRAARPLGDLFGDDPGWRGGRWSGEGPLSGRIVLLPYTAAGGAQIAPGDLALLTTTGAEIPVHHVEDCGTGLLVWLGADPGPDCDPARLALIRSAAACGVIPARAGAGGAETGGDILVLRPGARIALGDMLIVNGVHMRAVTHLEERGGNRAVVAWLDNALPDAPVQSLRFASAAEGRGMARLAHPSPVPTPGVPVGAALVDHIRQSARQPVLPRDGSRPRVLFTSIVPPDPADQGNRIVTRNLMAHLVAQGFDVDLLLIGHVRPEMMRDRFGDRVRVFQWNFPAWQEEPSAALRRRILAELPGVMPEGTEAGTLARMAAEARNYHPFYIVADPVVRMAHALYAAHDYAAIICNYTHMLRIPCELAAIRPLPPVVVVTHDALSRLPFADGSQPIDTGYRLCTPEAERAALDAVPGALILAISQREVDYFRGLGLRNPVALCEYDGLQECARYRTVPANVEAATLVFHASGNPMNRMAISWFLDHCWEQILAAVPRARLLICGGICSHIPDALPGVDKLGLLSRDKLMETLSGASVAINPTRSGTGLKIKTVEAACLGLPAVCLPAAIEGLEDVAAQFCLAVEDAPGFSAACIRLLQDPAVWNGVRAKALAFAAERFAATRIYMALDRHMGWEGGTERRWASPRATQLPVDIAALTGPAAAPGSPLAVLGDLRRLGHSGAAARLAGDLLRGMGPDGRGLAALAGCAGPEAAMPAWLAAARRLARNPADPEGLVAQFVALDAAGAAQPALDSWRQLALALPVDGAISVLGKAATGPARAALRKMAGGFAPRPIPWPLGKRTALRHLLTPGQRVGLGWSPMEPWAAWTCGHYARLDLECAPVEGALRVALRGHGAPGGLAPSQAIRILANGSYIGRFMVARDNNLTDLEFTLSTQVPDGRLGLDLFIEDPAPLRRDDGGFKDRRLLGFALHNIELGSV